MTSNELERLTTLLSKLEADLHRKGAPKSVLARVTDIVTSIRWLEKHQ